MAEAKELLPSEVRARVLKEHTALRFTMDRVVSEAESPGPGLREALDRLFDDVHRVVELEHDLLLPTLRTIDAWGPERARRLSAWHLDIRERLERARAESSTCSGEELASIARAFVDSLREDLATEEREHLARELLRELPLPADTGASA